MTAPDAAAREVERPERRELWDEQPLDGKRAATLGGRLRGVPRKGSPADGSQTAR